MIKPLPANPREDIAAAIPADLDEADDLLHRFGRWAMTRMTRRRCGSAEHAYRPTKDEEDLTQAREPREHLMHPTDAMRAQRALAEVPHKWRVVLEVLYVPRRGGNGRIVKPELMLRLMRIPPKLSRERHIDGLRMFANIHRHKLAKLELAAIMRPPDTASETHACQLAGVGVSAEVEVCQ
jgi:hypothetical protein